MTYSLTLKIEEVYSSKMLVHFYQITWHFIPENSTFHRVSFPSADFLLDLLIDPEDGGSPVLSFLKI
jgi:hypothetical protein